MNHNGSCAIKYKTSTYCIELGIRAEHKLCLTGTPLTQDPASVWWQRPVFLDNTVFGDDLEAFLSKYHNRYAVYCKKQIANSMLPLVLKS